MLSTGIKCGQIPCHHVPGDRSDMQDIYAFDVGDFGKLGLLRQICDSGKLSLGVLWWKTDLGTNGADGRHVGYLQDHTFRVCDPELWKEMRQRFNPNARRIIDLHPLLPNDTVFHDAPVPSGVHRKQWLSDAMGKVRGSAVVFCDPDNGVIFDGQCDSRRHISSEEVCDLYRAGHSIIVYHTPNRSAPHDTQLESGLEHFQRQIAGLRAAWAAHFRRGSSRVFFVLAQEEHAACIGKTISQMQVSAWTQQGHFEFHGATNIKNRATVDLVRIVRKTADRASFEPRSLPASKQVQSVRAGNIGVETAGENRALVRVVLNDNGGLNTAANPWLHGIDVPCRLSAGDGLTFRIEAAFSGHSEMYRISPSALRLARRFGFAGNHLSKSTPIAFDAARAPAYHEDPPAQVAREPEENARAGRAAYAEIRSLCRGGRRPGPDGRKCWNYAAPGSDYCPQHEPKNPRTP